MLQSTEVSMITPTARLRSLYTSPIADTQADADSGQPPTCQCRRARNTGVRTRRACMQLGWVVSKWCLMVKCNHGTLLMTYLELSIISTVAQFQCSIISLICFKVHTGVFFKVTLALVFIFKNEKQRLSN